MFAPISDKKSFVSELLHRLRIRISTTGESEKEFAKRLGSSEALFKNLTSGSLPSADRLTVILEELGETLVLGAPVEEVPALNISVEGQDYTPVHLYDGTLSAGPGISNGDTTIIAQLAFRHDWLTKVGVSPKDASMARVSGDSMAPGIQSGDLVLIDTTKTIVPIRKRLKGSKVAPIFAFVQDGEARVKRIERPDAQLLVLMSDNPSYPTELVTDPLPESIRILGQVVWSGHVWR